MCDFMSKEVKVFLVSVIVIACIMAILNSIYIDYKNDELSTWLEENKMEISYIVGDEILNYSQLVSKYKNIDLYYYDMNKDKNTVAVSLTKIKTQSNYIVPYFKGIL